MSDGVQVRQRRGVVRYLFLSTLVAALALAVPGWADQAPKQKQVLVLYGGNRDAQIVAIGDRLLPRLLQNGLPEGVDYYSEFMDQRRRVDGEYTVAFRDYLRLRYTENALDLVIAMDSLALEFLGANRAELFPHVPVVFFSSRPVPRRLVNSAGVTAPLNLGDTLALATTLQPGLRHVFVVNGADSAYVTRAREEFKAFEGRLSITYLSNLPASELETRLAALPRDSIVFYMHVARDGAGRTFNPLDYLERIARVSNAPTYSWPSSALGRGIVGGSLRSLEGQVENIAAIALRVLRGESAESIPIVTPALSVREVDWRQIRRWGIDEARIPGNVVVTFKEPGLWSRYGGYLLSAIAIFAVQLALITALLVQRRRRRHAEHTVRTRESELRTSYDRIRGLGKRLLNEQESERSRIARDLHDDVSQQIALLEIDLELLSQAFPEGANALGEAVTRVHGIARSVHDLTHRLHPARLRLTGLVSALQGLQRELSRPGFVVSFTHENVPLQLPLDLTLCMFRVAQEGLQNAVKYSRAVRVTMHLSQTTDGLTLTITDDGTGFDVPSVWGKGLGLISMSERLDAVGGTFGVYSTPGRGTRLEGTVPLAAVGSSGAVAI